MVQEYGHEHHMVIHAYCHEYMLRDLPYLHKCLLLVKKVGSNARHERAVVDLIRCASHSSGHSHPYSVDLLLRASGISLLYHTAMLYTSH